MKQLFAFLWKFGRRLLTKELESPAGKMNLVGGIITTGLIAAILVKDFLTVFVNFVLSLLEKPLVPGASDMVIIGSLAFLLTYFYLSLKVIRDSE